MLTCHTSPTQEFTSHVSDIELIIVWINLPEGGRKGEEAIKDLMSHAKASEVDIVHKFLGFMEN